MNVQGPSFEILTEIDGVKILQNIEKYARICYKSEDKMTPESYLNFINKIVLTLHHESIIEHEYVSVKFIIDRGVSHELVRHRIANFTQSSTRYCNYSQDKFNSEINVIYPSMFKQPAEALSIWAKAMKAAEDAYMELIALGESPQMARSVLPNSLLTEIIVTANLREWRHILELRTSKNAHPQMREVMLPLLRELKSRIPLLFDHIEE